MPYPKIRKAVIPAAGFGTRFLPETKAMPKEMLPIVDKPVMQYIVEEVLASGIEEILVISGHAKRSIENHFDSAPQLERHLLKSGKTKLLEEIRKISDIKIHYTRQKYIRGTGDAVLCARDFIDDEPFAVILGDAMVYTGNYEPALRQLLDQYEKTGRPIIGCQTVNPAPVGSYKVLDGTQTAVPGLFKVSNIEQNPASTVQAGSFASIGRYILTPDVFDILEMTQPGRDGEIHFTDALRVMIHNSPVYAYNFKGIRYNTGDKLGYLKATVEFALRREDLGSQFKKYLQGVIEGLKQERG